MDALRSEGGSDETAPGRFLGLRPLVLLVVATVPTALLVLPDLLGLDWRTPFVQSVSLRPYALIALAGLLIALGVLARRRRWLLLPTVGLAVVTITAALLVLPRAIPARS